MSKITNPTVLIYKLKGPEVEYHVAITNGSTDFRDTVHRSVFGAGYIDEIMNAWSKTGYYMTEEIERLRASLKREEEKYDRLMGLTDTFDWQQQRLHVAAENVIKWLRQEAKDRYGDADKAESDACVRELRDALTFCESSGSIEKKGLAISLPDTSSKAFWSGTGKSEVFHPEVYRRWVKEAIERDCCIAGIGVEVK